MTPHYRIAIVLLWQDGKILATKRRADADHLANFWEFPGGKCAPDETPAEAACREAREELGVEIEVTAARSPIEFDYQVRRVTLYPFDAKIISGTPQPLEAAALRWIAAEELLDNDFPPANVSLLADIRQK